MITSNKQENMNFSPLFFKKKKENKKNQKEKRNTHMPNASISLPTPHK